MKWSHCIIHHSKGPDRKIRDLLSLRHYHMSWRHHGEIVTKTQAIDLIRKGHKIDAPWSDISYTNIIENIEGYYYPQFGRSPKRPGAHCLGMNDKALSICFVGDFDITEPKFEQYRIGGIVGGFIHKYYKIPLENFLPHRQFNKHKTCPGKMFDMNKLIREIKIVIKH